MYNWVPLLGNFENENGTIKFKGGELNFENIKPEGKKGPEVGNYICNQVFTDGTISADIEFPEFIAGTGCELILNFSTNPYKMLNAGIGGGGGTFCIRYYDGNKWERFADAGARSSIIPNKKYSVKVQMSGSKVILFIDEVETCRYNLPLTLIPRQVGIWTSGYKDIIISNYKIESKPPFAFIIMQFSTPFNNLYEEVIKPVCSQSGITTLRADESNSPGFIITDVINNIIEAQLIIAEISPVNANVYYEVGYAHALKKPTILIADKEIKLPFDISPFRTLFYENSIAGKRKIEEELKKHILAIMSNNS